MRENFVDKPLTKNHWYRLLRLGLTCRRGIVIHLTTLAFVIASCSQNPSGTLRTAPADGSTSQTSGESLPPPNKTEDALEAPDPEVVVVDDATPIGDCKTVALAENFVRRLTPTEYGNTVRDLLRISDLPTERLLVDSGPTGFEGDALGYSTSQLHAERFLEVSAEAAAAFSLTEILGECSPASRECVETFITEFGRKVFRRPLTPEERDEFLAFHSDLSPDFGPEEKLRLLVQTFLMAPEFLYRAEFGSPGDPLRPSGYEVATRLAFLIWASGPNERLLRLAEEGALSTPEQLSQEAERMLADEKSKRRVQDFFRQYLDLDAVAGLEKDATVAPDFAGLRGDMQEEVVNLVDYVFFSSTGTLKELLTANYAFLSNELAATLGLPAQETPESPLTLEGTGRKGVLTTSAFLARHADGRRSSPVHRGLFVRERLLCQTIPPPPDEVDIRVPDLEESMTNREQYALITQSDYCMGCHEMINPLGFAFEHFDAAGRYQDTENGKPIDSSGTLIGTDQDGPFRDAVELAEKLGRSQSVQNCFARTWFRYAYGRMENSRDDQCVLNWLETEFRASGGSLPELIGKLVATPVFSIQHQHERGLSCESTRPTNIFARHRRGRDCPTFSSGDGSQGPVRFSQATGDLLYPQRRGPRNLGHRGNRTKLCPFRNTRWSRASQRRSPDHSRRRQQSRQSAKSTLAASFGLQFDSHWRHRANPRRLPGELPRPFDRPSDHPKNQPPNQIRFTRNWSRRRPV